MEVEVAHIGSDSARGGEPHLRVHVGTVHVDEAAVLVDDVADVGNGFLKYTVGGRVGDHQCRQAVLVLQGMRQFIPITAMTVLMVCCRCCFREGENRP